MTFSAITSSSVAGGDDNSELSLAGISVLRSQSRLRGYRQLWVCESGCQEEDGIMRMREATSAKASRKACLVKSLYSVLGHRHSVPPLEIVLDCCPHAPEDILLLAFQTFRLP